MQAESSEIVEFVSYFIHYLASVLVFLLSCFADKRSTTDRGKANVCPENDSSVLSQAFFSWFDSFAWKGYQHTLVYDDIWDVDYDLKTAHFASKFESKLNRAFRRLKK